jgi:hypothetical protein
MRLRASTIASTSSSLIGHDWQVEPTEHPKDRHTLQEYDVPHDVLERWRGVLSDYLRARAALIRVIERQGWRIPGRPPASGTHIDVVFTGPPGPEQPEFVDVEDAASRSMRVDEWVQRNDDTWALRIPL